MAQFTVNPGRVDPYKGFKFRVKWDGKYVAGIDRISALKRTTEVVAYRDGADPSTTHKSPGLTRYEPITLERGISHDTEFEAWVNKVWKLGAARGNESALAAFRKDIVIELLNEAGQVVLAYQVQRAWPSEYQALPDLDASANVVAFERLVLQHEGWQRDSAIVEPVEPK